MHSVQALGCGAAGLKFRVSDLSRVDGVGPRGLGGGFRVQGLEFGVWVVRLRV